MIATRTLLSGSLAYDSPTRFSFLLFFVRLSPLAGGEWINARQSVVVGNTSAYGKAIEIGDAAIEQLAFSTLHVFPCFVCFSWSSLLRGFAFHANSVSRAGCQSLRATFIPIERRARSRLPALSSLGTRSRYDSRRRSRRSLCLSRRIMLPSARERTHTQGLSRAIQGDGSLSAAARSRPRHDAKSRRAKIPDVPRARTHTYTHTSAAVAPHAQRRELRRG